MADDFRITVEFGEDEHGIHFGRRLHERQFEHDVREGVGEGVLVTRDGPHVFLYTSTQKQAESVEKIVRLVLGEDVVSANVSPIMRWHPAEERWEDASKPLPQTAAAEHAEHERWEEEQAEERLEAEGITPIVRRWKYVLIGTATDDDAKALAERLRAEAPTGAKVTAEPSATIEWEVASDSPFSLFGGFGPRPGP
jgi:hypothetical protein